jgi:hypothetical protein
MRGPQALVLSGLILRKIFDRNQEEYTAAVPRTIPTIAVVEEAQAVLHDRSTSAEPYVTWVKEGRKYDLGALMVTQQPGSIPAEILSQGDNWFIFHLLSSTDLVSVRRANAHFSEDILSSLLNEPIAGQGVIWSSVGGAPYPISVRAFSFEKLHRVLDPAYNTGAVSTYASRLRQEHQAILAAAPAPAAPAAPVAAPVNGRTAIPSPGGPPDTEGVDVLARLEARAFGGLRRDEALRRRLGAEGVPWRDVMTALWRHLPPAIDHKERWDLAFKMVPQALTELFGPRDSVWETYRVDGKTWVRVIQAHERGPGPQNVPDDDPF